MLYTATIIILKIDIFICFEVLVKRIINQNGNMTSFSLLKQTFVKRESAVI